MSEEGRTYGGRSAAERAAQRRQRLIEAGIELIARVGVAQLTIEQVCAEAGLTKRYFYQEFASVDELVDAVMAEVLNRVAITSVEPQQAGSAEQWARARLAEFTATLAGDPRLGRLALVETFGADGALGRFRDQFVRRAVEVFLADMLPADVLQQADKGRLAMTAYALTGASAELFVAWLSGEVDVDADAIVGYLTGLYVAAADLLVERS